jgi:hypothetical protein
MQEFEAKFKVKDNGNKYLKSLCRDVHITQGAYDDNINSRDCFCLLVLVYLPFSNEESKLLGDLM